MIKVILAEDHKIVRNGIKILLETQHEIAVVAEGSNGQEILDLISNGLEVDIIVADLNMPEMDGLALTARLNKNGHSAKVIILTMLDNDKYVMQTFEAGAWGYLLKNLGEEELIFAIKSVHAGNRYLCTELALRMLDEKLKSAKYEQEKADIDLSNRELEVLNLIAEGYTNKEMGEKLFLSKRTIEGHRQALLEKTATKNTAMLIRFAYLNSYID